MLFHLYLELELFLTNMNDIFFWWIIRMTSYASKKTTLFLCFLRWKRQSFIANSWLDNYINHQRLRCETVNINKISINLNYHPSCCDRIQVLVCTVHDIDYGIAASLLNIRIIDIDVSRNAKITLIFSGSHFDNCTLYNPTNKINLMGSTISLFSP